MDFAFNEDQEELRRYVRQWLEEKSPSLVVRDLMEDPAGFSPDLWKQTADMGWQAMAIPEQYGGAGFGFLELAVILEEQGRALFVAPFLTTAVASQLIVHAGSEQQKQDLLPKIASGEITAAVAIPDSGGQIAVADTTTRATADGDSWILTGDKRFVAEGDSADVIVTAAQTENGVRLFVVDRSSFETTRLPTMDATRNQADVVFNDSQIPASAELAGDVATAVAITDRIFGAAIAIESVGAAEACLDMAVEYAKDRKQFNRPIGSFQSIKHMCADMLISLQAARSAAYFAAWAVNDDPTSAEAAESSAIAKAYCTDAFYSCAAKNIQIHGGIGFTWEHDAHLYFKRAKSSQLMFGTTQDHRRRLAELIGL